MRIGALPLIVADWPRSDRERIRVTLDHNVVDVRAFYRGDDEEPLRAGRVGITLPLSHLPALFDGIVKAHREALARGLIG